MKKQFIYILAILIFILAACTKENSKDETRIPVSTSEEISDEQGENASTGEDANEQENLEQDEKLENPKEPLYQLNDANWAIEPIDDANPKVVLLTIDDAPDKRALDMAKTLKKLDAPAIFFVNGHFLNTDEDKAVLSEIYDMGFAIGNHTETHANLQAISEEEQRDEILTVSDTVEEIIGERPKFFRAPFGQNTDYSKKIVAENGMLLMNWSYGYDWNKSYMEKNALIDIMVSAPGLSNGANLLMHDRDWTADALREIVEGLRAKGYDFVDPHTIKGIES